MVAASSDSGLLQRARRDVIDFSLRIVTRHALARQLRDAAADVALGALFGLRKSGALHDSSIGG
jgi:hypothetical protein